MNTKKGVSSENEKFEQELAFVFTELEELLSLQKRNPDKQRQALEALTKQEKIWSAAVVL